MDERMREAYPEMTDARELAMELGRDFGWEPSVRSVYMRAHRLGLSKRPVANHDGRAEREVRWSREPEMEAWMLGHDRGQGTDLLSEEFRERFGFGLSRHQVSLFRSTHGTQTRRNHGGGSPRRAVGEVLWKRGYPYVKVAEEPGVPCTKDNWRPAQVVAWERERGPLPEGHVVLFADGDRANLDPENLVAVPRDLLAVMNSLGVGWSDRETLEACAAMARLRSRARELESAGPRRCAVCGREFVPTGGQAAYTRPVRTCPACLAAGRRAPGRRGR